MKLKALVSSSLIALVTSLGTAAHAQTFSVIHSFKGGSFDGSSPESGVSIRGNALYGTTVGGGNDCGMGIGCGTVYQLRHVGSYWFESLIYRFSGTEGSVPVARVVFGPDGHLYGTTNHGFFDNDGSVYRLTPPLSFCTAGCFWTENDLHIFTGTGGDGANPISGDLIWDQQGNLYGTTAGGGGGGVGTVFQMTGSGDDWTETPIYSFGTGGSFPVSGVVMDGNGNLFGTTPHGGASDDGTVYELTYDPQAGWKETTLYSFTGGVPPRSAKFLCASGARFAGAFNSTTSALAFLPESLAVFGIIMVLWQ